LALEQRDPPLDFKSISRKSKSLSFPWD